jgi:hypothetical protein
MALALHPTQECVILHGVTWATFEHLLADRGDHASVCIAYDQGTTELPGEIPCSYYPQRPDTPPARARGHAYPLAA